MNMLQTHYNVWSQLFRQTFKDPRCASAVLVGQVLSDIFLFSIEYFLFSIDRGDKTKFAKGVFFKNVSEHPKKRWQKITVCR